MTYLLTDSLETVLNHQNTLSTSLASEGGHKLADSVKTIEAQVLAEGDQALLALARQYDGAEEMTSLWVTEAETQAAYDQVSETLILALKEAKNNIEKFHLNQRPKDWEMGSDASSYGVRYHPIDCAGLYVPGGRAVYPSSVLMNAIPAKIAGVETIVMATPPNKAGSVHPAVLVASDICGVSKILKSGGAQAVFALAYGTESVPKVDKIVGPGNAFVTKAKQMVFGKVDIDKPAGPSEVLVYVESANYAGFAASECLAQLEHDPLSSAVVVSTDLSVLQQIQSAVDEQLPKLKRQEVLEQSIENLILLHVSDSEKAMKAINAIASEHLVLLLENYEPVLSQVKHAGSVFCGPYTPVALGDYYAGPNHVLPTERSARFASPLNVMDFMKFSSWLTYSKEALHKADPAMKVLTEAEGLDAHYQTVWHRLNS